MSINCQCLESSVGHVQHKAGLSSSLTNVILDLDNGHSSLVVQTGDTASLYIDKFGNIGVNTTWPTAQFEVASDVGACLRLRHGNELTSPYADVFMNAAGDLIIASDQIGSNIKLASTTDITNHNGSTSGLMLGGVLVHATADQLNYTVSIPGSAVASKAIILDSSKNINGINSFGATAISGTLQTSSQPNITSVGTLSSLIVTGDITVGGNINISGSAATLPDYLANITPGVALPSKTLVLNNSGNISGINSLAATSISGTITTSVQPIITSVGTLVSLTVSGAINATNTTDSVSPITGSITTTGGIGIAKSLFVGTGIYGTIATATQPNITSVGTLGSLAVVGAISAGSLAGTITTAAQPNITSVGTLGSLAVTNGITSTSIALGGVLLSSVQASYLTGITIGTSAASKALIMSTSNNIAGINSLGASTISLTGTTIATSAPTLNISANSGTTTGNIFINGSTNQFGFNTQTLRTEYSMTLNGTATQSGIFATGANTMIHLDNISPSGSSGRTSIEFNSDTGSTLEIGQRNSLETTVPNGFYIYNTNYLLTLSTDGMLSLPLTTATTALNIGTATSGFTTAAKVVVCNNTIAANSRQGFYIGNSLATNNSACFSHYNVASGSASNRLGIGFYGKEDTVTVMSSGRVGIGNIAPAVPLHITGSVTLTLANATSGHGYVTSGGAGWSFSSRTVALGLRVDSGVHVGSVGVFVTSDRRTKTNIQSINKDDAIDFIMNTEPRTYQLRDNSSNQIGYIAQELKSSRFGSLVSFGFEQEDLPAESDDDVENMLLVAQYERICCILHKGLQDALNRISELENKHCKCPQPLVA